MVQPLRAESVEVALCHVGNADNGPDSLTRLGAVSYEFDIGKFNITEAQYTAFLNAVASNDRYRLYSRYMAQVGKSVPSSNVDDPLDHWDYGIARSGESGSYTYSVLGISGSLPAVWITWFDAARFCNWMQNGQPTGLGEVAGSTEDGAYTLNGDYRKGGEPRNAGAKWCIPSGNEWYKAAFYDPGLNRGTGGYWLYPTQSNDVPGNTIGGGKNQANAIVNASFAVKGKFGSKVILITPVGSFPNTHSYYGCCDIIGTSQWTDTNIPITIRSPGQYRGLVGGEPNTFTFELKSTTYRFDVGGLPDRETGWATGFRVARLP
jgi:formylglycine-generating enzyme required for sulfatase activity